MMTVYWACICWFVKKIYFLLFLAVPCGEERALVAQEGHQLCSRHLAVGISLDTSKDESTQ